MSTKLKSKVFLRKSLPHILIVLIISGILFVSFPLVKSKYQVEADLISRHIEEPETNLDSRFSLFHENTVIPTSEIETKPAVKTVVSSVSSEKQVTVLEVLNTTITGYSSTVDQTNSDPFITASGHWVRDGIVAANFLPFGTQIRIPEAFGDKIFVVKDRMNKRHNNRVDVWFQTRQQALTFGIKYMYIEVVEVH